LSVWGEISGDSLRNIAFEKIVCESPLISPSVTPQSPVILSVSEGSSDAETETLKDFIFVEVNSSYL
jgi:hypothetical protein